MERMILDARGVNLGTSVTPWFPGPRHVRFIGAVFTPADPSLYLYPVQIPDRYDLIVYPDNTAAADGLPFQYPSGWRGTGVEW